MSTNGALPTFAAIISAFCDFLTVVVHTVIYERKIYHSTTFISARKYNYPVRQSRHPKVCQWITDAVAAIETELLNGTVARIAIVIYSSEQKPLERFMLDTSRFPTVAKEEIHTPIERVDGRAPDVDLEEQFRAVMQKVSTCGSSLKPVPSGSTFTMAVELKDSADPPIGHPQPWVPAQPSLQRHVTNVDGSREETRRGAELGGVLTTPIRTVGVDEVTFEMWIEEGRAKFDVDSQQTSQTESI